MTVISPLQSKIKSLPLSSGVYQMHNAAGEIIYVGKAVSLRRRVQSYFRGKGHDFKTTQLVSHISDITCITTQSEAEALILEASLVNKLQPKYNIDLKDDKSYPYLHISAGEFPMVSIARRSPRSQDIPPGKWFGPYTDAALIRDALTLIRKIFPFRTCDPVPSRSCLYYDIGLCNAPCSGKVGAKEYAGNIRRIALILDGGRDELYRQLKDDMESAASAKDFEGAARLRDQLRAIGSLYSSSPDVNYFKEAEQLERALSLPKRPERVECIDISTTMGERAVGSLVSFFNGVPDKPNYRRFRIKDVQGMDDFRMVAEVVRRRYGRLQREHKPYPDLVIIDGGKGQLSSAAAELKKLGITIALISLAKREEEVYLPGKRNPVILSRGSLALKLLQRARDEAHRFAIAYHRLLRAKKVFE